MKKFLFVVLVVAIAVAGWFAVKKHRAEDAEAEAGGKAAAKVETVVLKAEPISRTIEVLGVVGSAPSAEHIIAAPFDCVVTSVHVATGTAVAAGDLLVEIEPNRDTQLNLELARGQSALAAKALAAPQERFDLKLVTNQDLLAAQQAAQEAQLKLASLAARGLGGNGKILAPEAGVVGKLELLAGSLVAQGAPLLNFASSSRRVVRLAIEPALAGSVAAGQAVSLGSTQRADLEKISATVGVVGVALDPASGAVEVQVTLPEAAPLLLGEHVRAEIEIAKKDAALVVPRSAVLPDDDKQVLFTVKNGKAVRHEVKLGLANAEAVEVIAVDLQPGDTVVILGNYELEDGMAIQPAGKEAPEAKP